MIPMLFSEVRVTAVADTPVLLLREQQGERHLAVWITAAGGNAILSALEDSDEEHPSTHDLMIDALAVLDAVVEAVHITGLEVFVHLGGGHGQGGPADQALFVEKKAAAVNPQVYAAVLITQFPHRAAKIIQGLHDQAVVGLVNFQQLQKLEQ